MELYAEKPITETRTFITATQDFVIASSSMQGWRTTMEDGHTIIVNNEPDAEMQVYLGVFDGHGGQSVSHFVTNNLHHAIFNEIQLAGRDPKASIQEGYLRVDNMMQRSIAFQSGGAGSTAVIVIIRNGMLYCANVGDSRAVAFVRNTAFPLSHDHKPYCPDEVTRIVRAGGFIDQGRVNGDLALTRAFGDFVYKLNPYKIPKEQVISCFPDVIEMKIDVSLEFVVLACDGVWDVMSNEATCEFVKRRLGRNVNLSAICDQLLFNCLCSNRCQNSDGMDNMTVIILVFKNSLNQPYRRMTASSSLNVHYVCTPDTIERQMSVSG